MILFCFGRCATGAAPWAWRDRRGAARLQWLKYYIELGEWDEANAMPLIPFIMDPIMYHTGLLPAPQSTTRVEFRWIFIKHGAPTITEVERGSDPTRVYKYLDLEPDLDGHTPYAEGGVPRPEALAGRRSSDSKGLYQSAEAAWWRY